MLRPPGDTKPLVATSILLQRLHDEIPVECFTLGWLMHSLHKRSFGIITLAGLLLMIPAFQMIIGKTAPAFPRRIAAHPLPAKYLSAVLQRSVPVLRYLEHVVHPRWHTPIEATKRTVGVAVFMLSVALVFIPLPLSNVVPALVIALLSLAYLEEDGVLLAVAMLTAVITLSAAAAAVWGMAIGTKWMIGLW
jgi:hypothetical protein